MTILTRRGGGGGGGWQRGLEPSLHHRPSYEIWPSETEHHFPSKQIWRRRWAENADMEGP